MPTNTPLFSMKHSVQENQFLTLTCKLRFSVSFPFLDCLDQTRVGRPTLMRCRRRHRVDLTTRVHAVLREQ